ncbi:MAG: hypothetical protein PVG89_02670 [Gammaproteobacteria bacterium]|jgi:hypothetical protein
MHKPLKISMVVAGLLALVVVVQTLHTKGGSTRSVAVTLPAQSHFPGDREMQTNTGQSDVSADSLALTTDQPVVAKSGEDTAGETVTDPATLPDEKDPEQLLQEFVTSGDPQGIRRVFAERRKERAKLVKARMDHQAVDLEWSEDLASRFEFARALVPELADLKLTQTDCRDTICAIHIAYADASYEQYRPFLQQVGIVLGGDAWVHHDALPDGGVIYVARDSEELPALKQL